MSRRIDEGLFVPVNGMDQWVTLRGAEAPHPALLIVTGPGAAFSRMAPVFAPWEADFTVVQWDQPGAGATCAKHGPAPEPFTFDRLAADGIALAAWVRSRLGAPVVLFCLSGGTVTGLKMIAARPDLFAAYVAQGQVVDWAAQEQTSYDLILERARAAGDAAAVAEIKGMGRPPWRDIAAELVKSKYANAMTAREQAAVDPAAMAAVRAPPADASWVAKGLPEIDPYASSLAAYEAIKPELAAFKARDLGLSFEVPMVFLQGEADAHTTTPEVAAYAAELRAPAVVYDEIEGAGHMAMFLAAELGERLRDRVGPLLTSC